MFGTASFFVFKDPTRPLVEEEGQTVVKEKEIDFEFIQKEITKVSQMIQNTKIEKLKDSEKYIEQEK